MKKDVTTIIEETRRLFGLTRDEYALCAFVQFRIADPRNIKPGWCSDPKTEIADFVGITRQGLYKMIDRLESIDLLEVDPITGHLRVTVQWIDSKTGSKQSLQSGVNLVDTECKQSLQAGVNLVAPIIKVKEDIKEEEEENTHAQNETLKAKQILSNGGPSLRDYPKAGTDTPTKLLAELRRLYAANPEEWRATIDGTPAMNWPDKKRSEVIAKFCDHAIFSGWENRQFKQINARLKQWLKDEQYMDRQKQATPQATPQGPAYKPFSH